MPATKARQERNRLKKLAEEAQSVVKVDVNANPFWRDVLKKPTLIAAPMVRHTDLPCRMMFRAHGAQLCYTAMIDSDKYVAGDASTRDNFFTTDPADRPLVVQLGASKEEDFIEAARLLQGRCDAVCLNMDCPQAI